MKIDRLELGKDLSFLIFKHRLTNAVLVATTETDLVALSTDITPEGTTQLLLSAVRDINGKDGSSSGLLIPDEKGSYIHVPQNTYEA
jgi:hypothetical protein